MALGQVVYSLPYVFDFVSRLVLICIILYNYITSSFSSSYFCVPVCSFPSENCQYCW